MKIRAVNVSRLCAFNCKFCLSIVRIIKSKIIPLCEVLQSEIQFCTSAQLDVRICFLRSSISETRESPMKVSICFNRMSCICACDVPVLVVLILVIGRWWTKTPIGRWYALLTQPTQLFIEKQWIRSKCVRACVSFVLPPRIENNNKLMQTVFITK